MAILEFLWFALTSPWRFMPIIWPVFLLTGVMALVFVFVIRPWAFRAVGKDRVHPLMRSTLGWPVFVIASTFGIMWLAIGMAVGALTLAAMTRT